MAQNIGVGSLRTQPRLPEGGWGPVERQVISVCWTTDKGYAVRVGERPIVPEPENEYEYTPARASIVAAIQALMMFPEGDRAKTEVTVVIDFELAYKYLHGDKSGHKDKRQAFWSLAKKFAKVSVQHGGPSRSLLTACCHDAMEQVLNCSAEAGTFAYSKKDAEALMAARQTTSVEEPAFGSF